MTDERERIFGEEIERQRNVFAIVSAAVDAIAWCAACVVSIFFMLKYMSYLPKDWVRYTWGNKGLGLLLGSVLLVAGGTMLYVFVSLMSLSKRIIMRMGFEDSWLSRQFGSDVAPALVLAFWIVSGMMVWSISYQALISLSLVSPPAAR